MQIINPNLIPITAFEALQLIRDVKAEQEQHLKEEIDKLEKQSEQDGVNEKHLQQDRSTLIQQLIPNNLNDLIHQFLLYYQSSLLKLPQLRQSSNSILKLCSSLRNQFGQVSGNLNGLSKAERLQICDLAPTELVEIYMIIEECDSRFTEAQVESILNLVKENLSVETNGATGGARINENIVGINGAGKHFGYEQHVMNEEEDDDFNLGDVDDDDALVAEAREGGPAPDQELDEVPD